MRQEKNWIGVDLGGTKVEAARLEAFAYPKVVEDLRIEVSQHPNIAVLGAAMLCQ